MTAVRRPLLAGNWKMNGLAEDGRQLARAIVAACGDLSCEILLCPPFTLLDAIGGELDDSAVALGAQDCHGEASGAFTGDISVAMLADLGCRYVIVGHSERRAGHGESDEVVNAKAAAVHAAGLTAIICVGEIAAQRDEGMALAIVSASLEGSMPDSANPENTVIAYEPVWAIGTGQAAGPEEVEEMHSHIRELLMMKFGDAADAVRLLYGGSVKPDNAAAVMTCEDVDGALIGGASLDAAGFVAIGQSCLAPA